MKQRSQSPIGNWPHSRTTTTLIATRGWCNNETISGSVPKIDFSSIENQCVEVANVKLFIL